jgi:hypothetical protein
MVDWEPDPKPNPEIQYPQISRGDVRDWYYHVSSKAEATGEK